MAQPNWITIAGSIGSYPSNVVMATAFQLQAQAVLPATTVSYAIISGNLPLGVTMNEAGLIFGTPGLVTSNTIYYFVVRVTDNLQNIRDRTFSMEVSGVSGPQFVDSIGPIVVNDSTWVELQVGYTNPVPTNPVAIRVVQGRLPPGIEINTSGIIRGYAAPPLLNVTLPTVVTVATAISSNNIIGFSTADFSIGRPVKFSGSVFGGVTLGQTYYIKTILNESTFTISTTVDGPIYPLSNSVGNMTVTLPGVEVGQPTIQTYSVTLNLESPLGQDTTSYAITVINQNTPVSFGGPGYPPNSRVPTLYNTRPPTYDISVDQENYRYYLLPPIGTVTPGVTYPLTMPAYAGQAASENYFSFRMMGHDFDGNALEYAFSDLPEWLTGDPETGWLTGNPVIADNSISEYYFSVSARKATNPTISTPSINFSLKISNGLSGDIIWTTANDLGQINNGSISLLNVSATSDVSLTYRVIEGELPPNLVLLDNGEISGVVAYQPTPALLSLATITDFTFTIEAFSPDYPVIKSTREFTLSVFQEFNQPTDTLYIKCSPSVEDRYLIASLLEDNILIPDDYLYRPNDPYFGKATSVIYEHAYGIYASSFDEYVAAITRNHYWRNLTLGELNTAVARDANGNIIYEVVYSKIIDNLVNPDGVSIPEEIYWPRFIPLNLGPWYTSITNIFTSYVSATNGSLYYTSLSPGYARILYPNSLPDMRSRVGQVLGQDYNSSILPVWMTSQQRNGSTTGFVPVWVIAYTKPGYADIIKNNIETQWKDSAGQVKTLNTINFRIDRFTVDKSITYNYDKNLNPAAWTGLPSGTPVPDPLDSKDFYALFPRKTILPGSTQY
jgi:hypothetical protein